MTVPGKGGPPKGYKQTPEHIANVTAAQKGKKQTVAQREALERRNADPEFRARLMAAVIANNKGREMLTTRGERHWNWKEEPSYLAVHKRLIRQSIENALDRCIDCGKEGRLEWSLKDLVSPANVRIQQTGMHAGRTYSIVFEDYERRCRHCHMMQDRSGSKHWTARR